MCTDRRATLESVLKIKVDKPYRNMVRSSYTEKRKNEMTDYAMFTEKGNVMVNAIVTAAMHMGRDFDYVMSRLEILQKTAAYSECCDTEVRETVYEVLKLGKQNYA